MYWNISLDDNILHQQKNHEKVLSLEVHLGQYLHQIVSNEI